MSSLSWNLHSFKTYFIFGNNQKSFRAKLGEWKGIEWNGYSISVIELWARYCLTAPCELKHFDGGESNHWAKVQASFYAQLLVTTSVFPYNKLGWLFGLVEWIDSEEYPWYQISGEHSLHLWFWCKLSWVVGMSVISIANVVICLSDHIESTMFYLLWYFLTKSCLQLTTKIGTQTNVPKRRTTHVLSSPQLPHTHLYCDWISSLPLSHTIK